MTSYRVEVVTPWRVVDDVNEMAAALDYPAAWWDATGQPDANIPPTPNLLIAGGEVDEATLALIEADSRYFVLSAEAIKVAGGDT